jgi:phage terminase large subunit-like protein
MAPSNIYKHDLVRIAAEQSFEALVRLVHPGRVIGNVHSELMNWITREDKKSHQLVLMPRDHGKSAYAGYYAVWRIIRNPAIRILYISATANLATKQLKFIKDILASSQVRKYWPELVNFDEGRREKWTESEIAVDHPKRKEEYIRDPTVWAAGLTTHIVGMHADLIIMDDVVDRENATTEEGRAKVSLQYSYLASIEGAYSEQLIVGTRYHPQDLYSSLLEAKVELFDSEGTLTGEDPLYEVFERQVEDRGDGTGEFLWPRQRTKDGREFGFNVEILARKRAQYRENIADYYAQYYNDPNHVSAGGIPRSAFQYYDKAFLSRSNGYWYYKQTRLNVFAAIDFAFSLAKRSDYTAVAVVGVDGNQNYYVLEISRFKAQEISEYFKEILNLHRKWDFRKLRAEVTAAQEVIVKDLKQNYIRVHGLALSIDEYRPTRNEGTKMERINAILRPKYDNHQVWHYQGGNCQVLEEELVVLKPPHDDCKDALASAIDVSYPPSIMVGNPMNSAKVMTHSRFGGIG